MTIYPKISLSFLNGFLLILPMLGLRYGIPALIRKDALAELDYFPPVQGVEKTALKVDFLSNTFLVFSPLLAKIQPWSFAASIAWVIYLTGIGLMLASLVQYSKNPGLKNTGVFRYSRNPICLGYFLIYIGTSLLIGSWFHLGLAVIYQIAVHFLILSEERWCRKSFGAHYQNYLESTPRYILLKGK
jgi:hypothetical protein